MEWMTEALEQCSSLNEALVNVRIQAARDESMGVMGMFEDAALHFGAVRSQLEDAIQLGKRDRVQLIEASARTLFTFDELLVDLELSLSGVACEQGVAGRGGGV
jgi:hypothetical protein